jgi:hypothetical protein
VHFQWSSDAFCYFEYIEIQGRYFKVGECLYLGNGGREAKGYPTFLGYKKYLSQNNGRNDYLAFLDRALKRLEGLFAQTLVVRKYQISE